MQKGLGKYDAPLKMQFDKGSIDFKAGRVINPFSKDTMQYREWERGFNKSYFAALKRQNEYESKARSGTISEGEVQHV